MAVLGVIADVHGNREALEQVLRKLDLLDVEVIYCLGDLIGYCAEPNACIAIAKERALRCIHGNHELIALARLGYERCAPRPAYALRRTRQTLDGASRAYIEALPPYLEDGRAVFIHGGVDDVCEYMTSPARILANARALEARFPGKDVCFFGHTHAPKVYEVHGDRVVEHDGEGRMVFPGGGAPLFVNPGAVDGSRNPRDELARFAVFDDRARSITFYSVPYDHPAVEQRARDQGYRLPRAVAAWHKLAGLADRLVHFTRRARRLTSAITRRHDRC